MPPKIFLGVLQLPVNIDTDSFDVLADVDVCARFDVLADE